MNKKTLAWFPIWVGDWVVGTLGWTAEEKGHYLTLLVVQWDQGLLPATLTELERLSPGISAVWNRLSEKFEACSDGNLRNLKLESVRNEQIERHEKAVKSGRKGGKAAAKGRYSNPSREPSRVAIASLVANGVAKPYQSEPEPEPDTKGNDSPIGESRRDGLKPAPPGTPDDDFNEFLPNLEKGATPETADAPTRPGEAARRPTRAKRVYRIGWDAERAFTGISEADRKNWQSAYPAVNIDRALAAAHAWLIANPLKAKKSNWGAFINRWLSREQDRGGDAASNRAGPTVRTADERSRCWRDDALANMTQSAYDRWRVERGMLPEGEQMALNAKRAAAKRAENLAARTGGTGNEFLQIRRPDAG